MTDEDNTDQENTGRNGADPAARDRAAGLEGRPGVSRRGFVLGAAAGSAALGAAAGIVGTRGIEAANAEPADPFNGDVEHVFYTGDHQAGIRTPPQRYCVFMTFDLSAVEASELQVLLARWSAAIAQLMKGLTVGSAAPTQPSAIPGDTGEAVDLGPSSLTVTLGLGPGVFDERFGLAAKKPAFLADLPALPSDVLQPGLTGGDLSLQACADDPQVAYHAIRDLARMGRGTVTTRWTVIGFGRASAGPDQATPRNLMGFKDGTRNVTTDAEYDSFVWAGDGDQEWMRGGTYQVARKIQMNIEIWDADRVGDQQDVFGRFKGTGAPLTGAHEHDTPHFARTDAAGAAIIPQTSHIALAAHENNGGLKILRRPYNYTDGISQYGQLDAGLLFLAYVNDPEHFVRLQRKLGSSDRLNDYITHIGSAVFAIPPAPTVGHYIGQALFD